MSVSFRKETAHPKEHNIHQDECTWTIPDSLAEAAGVDAVWAPGNHMTLYAKNPVIREYVCSKRTTEAEHRQSRFAPCKPYLHHISWEVTLFDPVMRQLVNESAGIFLELQTRVSGHSESTILPSQLVKASRQYRSVMKYCIENLQSASDQSEEEKKKHYDLLSDIMYKMELVWHLVEILFIDVHHGTRVILPLLEWIRLHFPDCEEKGFAVLESGDPESHTDYWDAIYGYTLQGQLEHVQKLLSKHSKCHTDPFLSISEMLRKMPLPSFTSFAEFDIQWCHWHAEMVSRVEDGHYVAHPKLQTVAKILIGDEETLESQKHLLETWYHFLVSYLLYTNPAVKSLGLSSRVERCINLFGGTGYNTQLDDILVAALELNSLQVIQKSQQVLDNQWFTSHLTNLLLHTEHLNSQKIQEEIFSDSLHEFLLIDYAVSLFSHESLWQVGVLYLDHCPRQGSHILPMLLERVPLDSEAKANKVISIAEQRNLTSVVVDICKVMAAHSLHQKQLGSALSWSLRCQDPKHSSYIADKFLKEFCKEGRFSGVDLLDSLGSAMVISDRLTFLGKYREFHNLYGCDKKAAAELLVSLLTSHIAPKYIWPSMFNDILPILEDDSVILKTEDIYKMMGCVENLEDDSEAVTDIRGWKENSRVVKRALAVKLAHGILNEGSV